MRWRARRALPPSVDLAAIEAEAQEARRALAKARADEPRVARIAEQHKRAQAENHFGPRIYQALKGGSR